VIYWSIALAVFVAGIVSSATGDAGTARNYFLLDALALLFYGINRATKKR
jgi:hypothetical protein